MSLFQKSVEKKYLNELDSALIDKKFNDFQSYFGNTEIQENIRNLKEEEFQEGFIRELFVKNLNFTLKPKPEFNIVLEKKNVDDSRKADGAIIKNDHVVAIIELKSTVTTDLDTVETQAFGYKNHHPKCVYVITSNFGKLRFYIQNAVDYLEFDLFNLSREQFSLLWLCLSKDNIFKDLPLRIKESSVLQEENVTKKLYANYSKFREAIFENIVKNNPDKNELLLFNKTQKLLDRFLFVFFAEDRLLLPPNSISEIVKQWTTLKEELDAYIPLYDRFKKYFGYMNTGYKGKIYDIFPYNGGLFFPDEILDNITIDDNILHEHTVKLSAYDFETDVDVNILGHIFEHSLAEIENVQAKLRGEQIDKQKTKRKKEGIYYTPKYITKYIVENTVGKLCQEKRTELDIIDEKYVKDRKNRKKDTIKTLDKKLTAYKNWLLSLTILDPACGSGAFLNQALEFLIDEHKKVDELRAQLYGGGMVFSDITTEILEKNIYGVDLNEESVEIAKLSLWLRTAQKGRKLNTLSSNIKCGNSLIDDPEVAGEKAFNWQKEFPEIFAKGGFDVVIGNPPYVRVQFLPYQEIDFYKQTKKTAYKRVDISILFFEEGHKLLKENGKLSIITSNQFQTTEYGQETRRFIAHKYSIEKILDFGDLPVFEGALTYVSIYSLSKDNPKDFLYKRVHTIKEAQSGNYENFIEVSVKNINETKWVLVSKTELELLGKLEQLDTLGQIGNAWAGLFTGLDELLMFNREEMINSGIEEELFLPVIRANDPVRNGLAMPSKYVLYPYKEENGKTIVYNEEELHQLFPKGYSYLLANKEKLQSRKDSRKTFKDRKDWYALTRFGTKKVFKQNKIVSPGEVKEHKFSLDKSGSGFSCARVFAITVNDSLPLLGVLAILNSSLLKFYLHRKSSLKAGGYFSYSSKVLNDVPLPNSISEVIVSKTNSLLSSNSEYNKVIRNITHLLQSKFDFDKPSKKLQNWQELDFGDFLKELKKQKIPLSLSEEAEWMHYFNEQKQKALDIKAEIDKTDAEIDQMVYELYGLSEEEIIIVEESI